MKKPEPSPAVRVTSFSSRIRRVAYGCPPGDCSGVWRTRPILWPPIQGSERMQWHLTRMAC